MIQNSFSFFNDSRSVISTNSEKISLCSSERNSTNFDELNHATLHSLYKNKVYICVKHPVENDNRCKGMSCGDIKFKVVKTKVWSLKAILYI